MATRISESQYRGLSPAARAAAVENGTAPEKYSSPNNAWGPWSDPTGADNRTFTPDELAATRKYFGGSLNDAPQPGETWDQFATREDAASQRMGAAMVGLTPEARNRIINQMRRAQSYTPLESPDGQQLNSKASALRDLVLGRAGSWRGAAFGVSGSGSGGF